MLLEVTVNCVESVLTYRHGCDSNGESLGGSEVNLPLTNNSINWFRFLFSVFKSCGTRLRAVKCARLGGCRPPHAGSIFEDAHSKCFSNLNNPRSRIVSGAQYTVLAL